MLSMERGMSLVVVEGCLLVLGQILLVVLDGILKVALLQVQVGQALENVLRFNEVLLGLHVEGLLIFLDSLIIVLQSGVGQTSIEILGVSGVKAVAGIEQAVHILGCGLVVFLLHVEHHA